jgi:iron complex transport system permease protein
LILVTSAFLSLLVAFTGSIGFVGLIVPHVVRLASRPASTRALFLRAFALGAIFLSIADVAARCLLPPYEFPIGILTTLLGTPFFLYLLWKR